MPKVTIHLPEDLYLAARAQGLAISALAQRAIEQALRAAQTDEWVQSVRTRPDRVRLDVHGELDDAREEFGE